MIQKQKIIKMIFDIVAAQHEALANILLTPARFKLDILKKKTVIKSTERMCVWFCVVRCDIKK